MSYTSNANQREVIIHRNMPKGNEGSYVAVYNSSWREAYKKLNPIAFGVWMYLLGNKDGQNIWFSPAHIANELGCSVGRARTAFTELIKEGYIEEHGKNKYSFHENPQEPQLTLDILPLKEEKRIVAVDNRRRYCVTYQELYNVAGGSFTKEQIDELWNNSKPQEEA